MVVFIYNLHFPSTTVWEEPIQRSEALAYVTTDQRNVFAFTRITRIAHFFQLYSYSSRRNIIV